jgi:hypothetical protein
VVEVTADRVSRFAPGRDVRKIREVRKFWKQFELQVVRELELYQHSLPLYALIGQSTVFKRGAYVTGDG